MLVDNVCNLIEPSEESVQPASAAKLAAKRPLRELEPNEVQVWIANLRDYDPQSLFPVLADGEVSRANRFYLTRHRENFVNARGLLRLLVASYLNADPSAFTFTLNDFGKPFLRGGFEWLKFNVAHSGDMAAYAFARERELGIDIEYVRDDVDEEELSQRFFSQAEVADLKALPQQCKREAFFNCWTRKEAYIKACGKGLSLPLDSFSVSFAPGHTPALIAEDSSAADTSRWSMKSISVPAGYAGAIVVEGQDWRLQELVL
jgi:4'-phosphopantetheinyl transferase